MKNNECFENSTLLTAALGSLYAKDAPECRDGMHAADIESALRSAFKAVNMNPDSPVYLYPVYPVGCRLAFEDAYSKALSSLGYDAFDAEWHDTTYSVEEVDAMYQDWLKDHEDPDDDPYEPDEEPVFPQYSPEAPASAPRWYLVQSYEIRRMTPEALHFAVHHDEAFYMAAYGACKQNKLDPDEMIDAAGDGSYSYDDIFSPAREEDVHASFSYFMNFAHHTLDMSKDVKEGEAHV